MMNPGLKKIRRAFLLGFLSVVAGAFFVPVAQAQETECLSIRARLWVKDDPAAGVNFRAANSIFTAEGRSAFDGSPVVGSIVGREENMIVFHDDATLEVRRVPLSAVEHIEIATRRRATLQGAMVGAIAGSTTLFFVAKKAAEDCDHCWSTPTADFAGNLVAGLLGAALGSVTGAVIGSQIQVDGWEEVSFIPGMVLVPTLENEEFGLSLQTTFF